MTKTLAVFALTFASMPLFTPSPAIAAAPTNRLVSVTELTAAPAAWMSSNGTLVAYGSAGVWHVVRSGTTEALSGSVSEQIRDGVLAGRRLYIDRPSGVSVIDVGAENAPAIPLDLDLSPGSRRLLTRALDYLLVWEQGKGLHAVTLPPPIGHAPPDGSSHCAWPMVATPTGFVPVETPATALSSSGATVYAALATGDVALFELDDAGVPHAAGRIASVGPARALALNGARLFVLGEGELRVIDTAATGVAASPAVVYPGVSGNAIAVSGRLVVIGSDEGVFLSREPSITAATHFVTLTNFEFTPSSLTVDVNDTVQWNNNQGLHNVNSCNVGEIGCTSNATETFSSGAAATAPWNFSHTFLLPGPNPYTCTVHAGFGMVGTVTVNPASSPTPPAVPDGDAATAPLTVRKTTPNGSTLEVAFDDASCTGVAGTQIVGGGRNDLPASPGGIYNVTVSRCACGAASPCVWSNAPLPLPGQMIWFVMVARDAATTEGSWGTDGAGSERRGPGTGGHSAQCGSTAKNVTNSCGR